MESLFKFKTIISLSTIAIGITILLIPQSLLCFNSFSNSTGLYFYSAVLQANAAILSIVGVFMIFKIQSLQSWIDGAANVLMSDTGRTTPARIVEFEQMSLEKKKAFFESKKGYEPPHGPVLKQWIVNEEKIIKIKSSIKFPTIFLAFGIVTDSIGLLFANWVHEHGIGVESRVLYITLLLEIYILYLVINGIFKVLAE